MKPKSIDILQRLTAPKPFPKGTSEAEIAADLEKRKTTAALVAAVKKAEFLKGMRG